MTTAHKPTWNPARASENNGFLANGPTMSFSSHDVAAHTKLKFRSSSSAAASRDDLRDKLAEKESAHMKDAKRIRGDDDNDAAMMDDRAKRRKLSSADSHSDDERRGDSDMEDERPAKRSFTSSGAHDIDADDSSGSESSDSDSDSDSGDEMAELERELEKIKRERKEEQERKQREKEAVEAAQAERDAMMGNPLLAEQQGEEDGDFTIRRKWWEDTVFRNQAKGEPQYKKRFINDTLRNDFHKRFLNKYVK